MDEHEKDYSFMQETIKDEVGGKSKLKKDILRMAVLGVVFGAIASLSFSASKPWFEKQFAGEPQEVTIPEEETTAQDTEGTDDVEEEAAETETPELTIDSYRQLQKTMVEVGNEAAKSVVEINATIDEQEWKTESYDNQNSTTGVIVADNGQEILIWGKASVAEDAKKIQITFCDGRTYEASLKKQESILGFGVYAVARESIQKNTWDQIQIAELGNTTASVKGEPVIVLGDPFGYTGAMGFGTIASNRNVVDKADGQYRLICTDIAGAENGSGVIVNIDGEVIGIIDQDISDTSAMNLVTGYGISDIKKMIEQLSNGQSIPYLGIYGIDVTEEIEAQGIPKGVYVKAVDTDSPAMTAGIQSGDVITSINGEDVETLAEYHSVLMGLRPGKETKLEGKRQGTGGYVDVAFSVTIDNK